MEVSKISNYEFKQGNSSTVSMRLQSMESIYEQMKEDPGEPHRHDYYTVVWVINAEGQHLIDFNKYQLSSNQIYFISPGQIHHLIASKKPSGWVITFHPDFLLQSGIDEKFLKNINLFRAFTESPPIDVNRSQHLDKIIHLIHAYFHEEGEYQSEALGSLLELFLIECVRHCKEEHIEVNQELSCVLLDFKSNVERKFSSLHKVSDYANIQSITPKHLNEVVKNITGTTAKEYIVDRILMEAKRLLLHTSQSVKQVAIDVGFKEPLHFNSFFKKRVGKTPLEYRKSSQQ